MKNHELIGRKLLQTNKKFSHLKQSKKLKIHEWLYESYAEYASGQIKESEIVDAAYKKIEEATIWIPYGEIVIYYRSHKNKFRKRYEKAKLRESENQSQENIQ
ncbi:MAG: hypothetical protein NC177_18070 [Ruminococcus flavefaciens]|nr:hypothetical protein [Ruminococcus flavefaciens]